MKGPLEGIRVLDLSRGIAGPFAGQMLGDQGAEVIHIESPQGDLGRMDAGPKHRGESFYFMAWNRNKKSVVLDFRTQSGKQAFLDLVAVSDVVLENFRGDSMQRADLGYEVLKEINPRLIYCSIFGYSADGPYAERASNDVVALGETGVLSLNSEPGEAPIRPGAPIGDTSTAMNAAFGIVSALHKRHITGEGSRVEVSLLLSCMSQLSYQYSSYFLSGQLPKPNGRYHRSWAPFGIFKTRDGWIVIQGGWPQLTEVLGVQWMLDDPRFADMKGRVAHLDEFNRHINEATEKRDTAEWESLLRAAGITYGLVLQADKAAEHPEVKHLDGIIELEHSLGGTVRLVGSPIRIDGTGAKQYTAPPTLGQHNQAVLSDLLGYNQEQIARLETELAEKQQAN